MKRSKYMIIGLLTGFLTIATVAAVFLIFGGKLYHDKNKQGPEETFNQYISYINSRDYAKMYGLLNKKSKSEIPLAEFTSRNKKIYEGIEAKNLRVQVEKVSKTDEDKITIEYTAQMATLAGTLSYKGNAVLNQDDNKNY